MRHIKITNIYTAAVLVRGTLGPGVFVTIALIWGCLIAEAQQAPKDSDNLKSLEFLLGDWIVTVDARVSKNGPWERNTAQSSIKKAVGNTIFEEEVIGTRQDRGWIARCWIAADNRFSTYQLAFVDSDHGVLELYEGNMSNDSLILQKEIIFPQSRVLRRIIYSNFSKNSFNVRSMRSADNGATWDLTGSSLYERVNK